MKRSPVRRIWRYVWRTALVIVGILILLALAIQLPPVQRFLTGKIESSLQQRLQTDLGIGGIRLKFPKSVALRDVYLNTPEGDTLLRLHEATVNVGMWHLFRREICIRRIGVQGLSSDVVVTDSTSNLMFIIEAFSGGGDAGNQASGDVGWALRFPSTTVELRNSQIRYQDDPNGILLDLDLGRFTAKADDIDLRKQHFLFERMELKGSKVNVRILPVQDEEETAPRRLLLASRRIEIAESTTSIIIDTLTIVTEITEARIRESSLFAGDTLALNIGDARIDAPAFTMHRGPALQPAHFNPDHLLLHDIVGDLSYLHYQTDSLNTRIHRLAGKANGGIQVNELEGTLHYVPGVVLARDFNVATTRSSWRAEDLEFRYNPDSTSDMRAMSGNIDATGELSLADIRWIVPGLDTLAYFQKHANAVIQTTLKGSADYHIIDFSRLAIEAPGISCDAVLRIEQPYRADSLRARADIATFSCRTDVFLPFVPDTLFPEHIELPTTVRAAGTFAISPKELSFALQASETRPGMEQVTAVTASGSIANYRGTSPRFDVQVGDFNITRASALAYIPPATIPDGYLLPGQLKGSGRAKGTIDDMTFALQFALPGDSTHGSLEGIVRHLTVPDSISGDVQIHSLALAPADITAILPDTLVPQYLNLPEVSVTGGRVTGDLAGFYLDLPIESSVGSILVKGMYQADSIDMEVSAQDFSPPLLFTGDLRDTLQKLDLMDIQLEAYARGKTSLPRNLELRGAVWRSSGDSLLVFSGTAYDSTGNLQYRIGHSAIASRGQVFYEARDSMHYVDGAIWLDSADLRALGVTQDSVVFRTHIAGSAEFAGIQQLQGSAVFDSLRIQSRGGTSNIDSVQLNFRAQGQNNSLSLRSNIVDMDLEGHFNPTEIASHFGRVLRSYWQVDSTYATQVGDSIDLRLDVRVKRTQPLTDGLINGLDALSPFTMNAEYHSENRKLNVDLDLRSLIYRGIEAEDMILRITGDSSALSYNVEWEDIRMYNQVRVGRTRIAGDNSRSGYLSATLTVWNETDIERHRLTAYVDAFHDTVEVVMGEEQMLNFERWNMPGNNLIALVGDSIRIENWSMTAGSQHMTLINDGQDKVVVEFTSFDLYTFARLINTEEDLASGLINGRVEFNNIFGKTGVQSDLTIDDLRVLTSYLGSLTVDVRSEDEQTYAAHLSLQGGGNSFTLDGTYKVSGRSDLVLDIESLRMQSIEPFTFGYVDDSEGYITGRAEINGTFDDPDISGSLQFTDGAFSIAQFGARMEIGTTPIQFSGDRITLNNLQLFDESGNAAQVSGDITLRSLADVALNLRASADNFLVLNSTQEDNSLYYGKLSVDADVTVTGTARLPVVNVRASTNENSYLTYVYGLAQDGRIETTQGVVRFVEEYQWNEVVVEGARPDSVRRAAAGVDMRVNLALKDNVEVTILIDPVTDQKFVGRANGTLTYHRFPNGAEEVVGRVHLTEGTYDAVLSDGLIRRKFDVVEGSTVQFDGDMLNPRIDLHIRYAIRTSPRPLVTVLDPQADLTGLLRTQTFYVDLRLQGDLQQTDLTADILYPDDIPGNVGAGSIDAALSGLRTDQSRLRTAAFSLLAFRSFSFPLAGVGDSQPFFQATALSALDEALSQALSTTIASIQIDVGLDTYEEDETIRYNSRISLRRSLFDDRLTISVDGVTSSERNEETGTSSTYIDNITAEYILNEQGNLRLRIFNDRDHDALVGVNVIRYGGRLAFSKDFETLRFFGKREE